MVGGCTDERFELTRLCFPLMSALIVETQCLTTDGQRHLAALARLEEHLLECFQFLNGAVDAGLFVADVELDRLCSGTATRVGDVDGKGNLVVSC